MHREGAEDLDLFVKIYPVEYSERLPGAACSLIALWPHYSLAALLAVTSGTTVLTRRAGAPISLVGAPLGEEGAREPREAPSTSS
jgi:hypothetical protein